MYDIRSEVYIVGDATALPIQFQKRITKFWSWIDLHLFFTRNFYRVYAWATRDLLCEVTINLEYTLPLPDRDFSGLQFTLLYSLIVSYFFSSPFLSFPDSLSLSFLFVNLATPFIISFVLISNFSLRETFPSSRSSL